ncbi:hypothetical protein BDA96_06G197600 [Sorghum bicolor]|uniref:Uncharacterized protein n=2 Tax=Sorghum bicolor TaxID=4558 RepID=A0A921QRF2_SORBI|nr:hypothetical protein BDA96_06G197600 [Sorghum bicolor]KXG26916.1 hypothetical protein SORBI_3006G180800 [Sorghum bicolor]
MPEQQRLPSPLLLHLRHESHSARAHAAPSCLPLPLLSLPHRLTGVADLEVTTSTSSSPWRYPKAWMWRRRARIRWCGGRIRPLRIDAPPPPRHGNTGYAPTSSLLSLRRRSSEEVARLRPRF